MTVDDMEWEISYKGNAIRLQTVEKHLWESDVKKNGALKKNAKPSHGLVWYINDRACGSRRFWEQIVLEHNLWIHRDDREKIEALIRAAADLKVKELTALVTPLKSKLEDQT